LFTSLLTDLNAGEMSVSRDENLDLPTELIRLFGHHREIQKLTFGALDLRQRESRNCGLYVGYFPGKIPVFILIET